jgi:transcriptional regulator with XRE-family HTH domain
MDGQNGSPTLGKVVHARRLRLGWTQEELAARIADLGGETFRQSDVSRLERDRVTLPRRARLEHVAAALGLPIGELLALSGWAGAETAFRAEIPSPPTDGTAATSPGSAPASVPVPPAPTATAVGQPVVAHSRLSEAIERAKQTRARTEDVLRRCQVAHGGAGTPETGTSARRSVATAAPSPERGRRGPAPV